MDQKQPPPKNYNKMNNSKLSWTCRLRCMSETFFTSPFSQLCSWHIIVVVEGCAVVVPAAVAPPRGRTAVLLLLLLHP